MAEALLAVAYGYAIGSVPVAWIAGRLAGGIDIREYGSGNVGASNVWQTVSRALVVPVGLAQIGQGLAPVLIAKALDHGDGAQVAGGLAAVVATDWSPWLGFRGGRGVGASIGVLLGLSPVALAVFIAVSLAGVVLRAIPQGVAAAMWLAPLGALASGASATVVAGCFALAAIAMLKRLAGNAPPDDDAPRPEVWVNRLVYDRDVRDREAWVRRGVRGEE